MKICSFGGGVQSTAMAILAAQGKIEVDAFVFSDTGFEQSIVFEFLEKHTLPMLEQAGIPFYIAHAKDYAGKYFSDFALPPFFTLLNDEQGRKPAFCSHKWKKDVIHRFLREKFNADKYTMLMGFSTDEQHRAARMKPSKKYGLEFPLLDLQMRRGDCIALVERTFLANPPRSSCYFCPNHTQHEWREVMQSKDRKKVIAVDKSIRKIKGFDADLFLTVECKPIDECDFDDKNEVIFSRLCAGECFL